MAKVRLFVAVEVPKPVRAELMRAIGALRPALADAKWVPEQNLHLTLAFLGWADPEMVPEVSDAIASSVAGHVDFTARLGGLGAFPSMRRARVLWAGIDDPASGIAGLAGSVCDAVTAIGFPQEERPFHAHVTLARMRAQAPIELTGVDLDPLPIPVERVTLFQSNLGKPSPRYDALATFPFRRG
jgi:2'-5' RNA ligase